MSGLTTIMLVVQIAKQAIAVADFFVIPGSKFPGQTSALSTGPEKLSLRENAVCMCCNTGLQRVLLLSWQSEF